MEREETGSPRGYPEAISEEDRFDALKKWVGYLLLTRIIVQGGS
jgi:hypothetical protein